MKFSEVVSRVNGLSCPIFGVSWTPPKPDVSVARGLIAFLEDRRVLYSPSEVELREHCIQSVIEIRRHLTQVLIDGQIGDGLADQIRAMRAASRRFLDQNAVPRGDELWVPAERSGNGLDDYLLNQSLGELRGVFGVHVAMLAAKHGLDVEPPLDEILVPLIDEVTT